MKRYTNTAIRRKDSGTTGNADEGAQIKVFLADGITPAVVFSDFSGTVLPQPFFTNTLTQGDPAQFTFVADGGNYLVVVNGNLGVSKQTTIRVTIETGMNVLDFGAVGDGVTDDSEAFNKAFKAAVNTARQTTVGSNKVINGRIIIPACPVEYRIAQPRKFMSNVDAVRKVGLTFVGECAGVTVHFDFNTSDYLCFNNNEFLFVRFEKLRFTCNSINPKFLFSTADGGAQDYYFNDVEWQGTWNRLYDIRGTNNNAEWKFVACTVNADIADVMMSIEDSDQFLNYWWYGCKLWLSDGQCIRATKGGHFKFFGCDWSGLEPSMANNLSVNGAPLFELLGSTHARGVCSLEIFGGRFEHKNTLSKLIYSEWNIGNIYINADFTSSLYISPVDHAVFNVGNTQGSIVKFDSCSLDGDNGRHKYISGINGFTFSSLAVYDCCQFVNLTNINTFITSESPINKAGKYQVSVINSRTTAVNTSTTRRVIDCDIGAKETNGSNVKEHSFLFRGPNGEGTPTLGGSFFAILPENAIITKIRWFNDGSLTSANNVTLQLKDGAGVVISSQSGVISAGWDTTINKTAPLTSSNNTLELFDSLGNTNQTSINLFVVVSYIGG